jgi:hypothetical protein
LKNQSMPMPQTAATPKAVTVVSLLAPSGSVVLEVMLRPAPRSSGSSNARPCGSTA